jgi:hypothetical protein
MIGAFVNDVLKKIENEEVKTFIFEILHQRFDWELSN